MSLTIKGPLSWRWNKVFIPRFENNVEGCLPSRVSSSYFRFRDSKWRLDCCYNSGVVYLYLYRDVSFVLLVDTPITAFVQVEEGNDNGKVLPELCDRKHQLPSTGGCIWWRWEDDIQRSYPKFERDLKLTFQVTIKETNPQMSQGSDPSTQTERLPFVTASLLTANDIPANSSTHHSSIADSSKANSSTNHSKIQTTPSPSTSPSLVRLLQDFAKLRDEEPYSGMEAACDVAIKCTEIIIKSLSEQNAYDFLLVADQHSDFSLVEIIIEYMAKNKFPMSGDRWLKFSDEQPKLAVKVLNKFCQKWI